MAEDGLNYIACWFNSYCGYPQVQSLSTRLSPEMAVRVGKLLNTSPESWLRMQEAVDLWTLQQDPDKFADVKTLDKLRLQAVVA